ncbi:hypothetical protein PIB30_070176, partial [Stylosanthes scabra]|nr:hypothetical protein [Stylosanthes scabra]
TVNKSSAIIKKSRNRPSEATKTINDVPPSSIEDQNREIKRNPTEQDAAQVMSQSCSKKQKAVVRDMGFGALENLSILNISQKMMMELVNSFNTNDNSMRTTLGRIKLDVSKIGHALCNVPIFTTS